MPNEKKSVASRLLYFTPWRSITRAGQSIVTTKERLSETFDSLRQSLPHRSDADQFEEGDLRNIADHKERFEALYEANRWSEEELAAQIRACSRTKIVGLVCSGVALLSAIYSAGYAPLWMLVFLIPLEGCVIILGIAQAFKFALYQAQLVERSLFGARDFFSRADFFSRLVS